MSFWLAVWIKGLITSDQDEVGLNLRAEQLVPLRDIILKYSDSSKIGYNPLHAIDFSADNAIERFLAKDNPIPDYVPGEAADFVSIFILHVTEISMYSEMMSSSGFNVSELGRLSVKLEALHALEESRISTSYLAQIVNKDRDITNLTAERDALIVSVTTVESAHRETQLQLDDFVDLVDRLMVDLSVTHASEIESTISSMKNEIALRGLNIIALNDQITDLKAEEVILKYNRDDLELVIINLRADLQNVIVDRDAASAEIVNLRLVILELQANSNNSRPNMSTKRGDYSKGVTIVSISGIDYDSMNDSASPQGYANSVFSAGMTGEQVTAMDTVSGFTPTTATMTKTVPFFFCNDSSDGLGAVPVTYLANPSTLLSNAALSVFLSGDGYKMTYYELEITEIDSSTDVTVNVNCQTWSPSGYVFLNATDLPRHSKTKKFSFQSGTNNGIKITESTSDLGWCNIQSNFSPVLIQINSSRNVTIKVGLKFCFTLGFKDSFGYIATKTIPTVVLHTGIRVFNDCFGNFADGISHDIIYNHPTIDTKGTKLIPVQVIDESGEEVDSDAFLPVSSVEMIHNGD